MSTHIGAVLRPFTGIYWQNDVFLSGSADQPAFSRSRETTVNREHLPGAPARSAAETRPTPIDGEPLTGDTLQHDRIDPVLFR